MSVFVYSSRFCEQLTISFCQRLRHFMQAQQIDPEMDPRLHYNAAQPYCALTFVAPDAGLMQALSDVAEQAARLELDLEVAPDSAAIIWQTAEPFITLIENLEALTLDLLPPLVHTTKPPAIMDEGTAKQIFREQPYLLNFANRPEGYSSYCQLFREAVSEMRLTEGREYSFPCEYLRRQAQFEERLPQKMPHDGAHITVK